MGFPNCDETGLLFVHEYSFAPEAMAVIVFPIQSPIGEVTVIVGFSLTETKISLA